MILLIKQLKIVSRFALGNLKKIRKYFEFFVLLKNLGPNVVGRVSASSCFYSTEASKFGNFYYKEWKSADETRKKVNFSNHYSEFSFIYFSYPTIFLSVSFQEIEEKYLQDIVHSAVYVKPAMAEKLRRVKTMNILHLLTTRNLFSFQVLQSFVNQKRIKTVDSLLFRLLKPVVWRGLNVKK